MDHKSRTDAFSLDLVRMARLSGCGGREKAEKDPAVWSHLS